MRIAMPICSAQMTHSQVARTGLFFAGMHRCTASTRRPQASPKQGFIHAPMTLQSSVPLWFSISRMFSSTPLRFSDHVSAVTQKQHLKHLTQDGAAHMVHIPPPTSCAPPSSATDLYSRLPGPGIKPPTARLAVARCILRFSNPSAMPLIHSSSLRKGDALALGRIAGIMGAKKTADLIPLCHNIPLSGVSVDVEAIQPGLSPAESEDSSDLKPTGQEDVGEFGAVVITARVHTFGQTGVEMEALTAATVAGLTVYDMCKAVDKRMTLGDCRVVLKEGGNSGRWVEKTQRS